MALFYLFSFRIAKCLSKSVTAWKAHCPTSPHSTSLNTESNRIFALAITKAGSPPESIPSLRRFAASTRDQAKLLPKNIVVVALRTSGSSSFYDRADHHFEGAAATWRMGLFL